MRIETGIYWNWKFKVSHHPKDTHIICRSYMQLFISEGLKPFLSLSFPSVHTIAEKPFPEFLKVFPDLKVIGKTFPATFLVDK